MQSVALSGEVDGIQDEADKNGEGVAQQYANDKDAGAIEESVAADAKHDRLEEPGKKHREKCCARWILDGDGETDRMQRPPGEPLGQQDE